MAKTAKKKWLSRFFTRKNKTKRKHSKRKTSTQKRKNSTQKHPKRKTSKRKRKRTKAGFLCSSVKKDCRGNKLLLTKGNCVICNKQSSRMHHCRLTGMRICQQHTIQVDKADKTTLPKLIEKNITSGKNITSQEQMKELMPYFKFVIYLLQTCGINNKIKICSDVKFLTHNLDKQYLEDAYNDIYVGRKIYTDYKTAANKELAPYLRLSDNPTRSNSTTLQKVQSRTRNQENIKAKIDKCQEKKNELSKQLIKTPKGSKKREKLEKDFIQNEKFLKMYEKQYNLSQ